MRIMFTVFDRPIKYLLDNYKEKLKLTLKNIIKETIRSAIPICIGYNENVTRVTLCVAKMNFQRSLSVATGLLCQMI